jgi:N-acetylneuraminic acid mutarotase
MVRESSLFRSRPALRRRAVLLALFALPAGLLLAAHAQPVSVPKPAYAPGSWTRLAPMLHPQNEALVAVLGRRIYVMGGFAPDVEGPTGRVQIYDTATNTWSDGTPLPDPVHHPGAAVVDGKIYIVGGFHEPFPKREPVGNTWVFDPATNHWDKRSPMPTPRGAMVMAAIGTRIYAAGGEHSRPPGTPVPPGALPAYEPITELLAYDTIADSWSKLPSMKVARDHSYVGVINNRLYVIGGRDRPKYDITTVEEFNPANGGWSEKAPMPTGRSGGFATVLNGEIYAFGGEGDPTSPRGVFNEVEAFNPATNTWREFGPMPLPRHSLVTAAVGGRIYLPGGATSRGGMNLTDYVDAFDPGR